MKIETWRDPSNMEYNVLCNMREDDMRHFGDGLIREIVRQLAERFVAENFTEIAAKLDQQAIATLSVAEAGAQLSRTLKEKIPDKIMHYHTEHTSASPPVVLQRGVLGGLKRL